MTGGPATPPARGVAVPAAPAQRALVVGIEDVEVRSACNTYNLALMAILAYSPQSFIRTLFAQLAGNRPPTSPPDGFPLLTRSVPATEGYDLSRFRFFESTQTHTQAYFISCGSYALLGFRGTEVTAWPPTDLRFDSVGVRYMYPYHEQARIDRLKQQFNRLTQIARDDSIDFATDSLSGDRVVEEITYRQGNGVHLGFLLAFESVREGVEAAVREYLGTGTKTVFIVGHSLGGAIALHAAAYFRHVFGDRARVRLYTYGQPRVGDNAWAAHYHRKFYYVRIRDNKDLVPTVPMSEWNLDANVPFYAHFGKHIRYADHGDNVRILSYRARIELYDEHYKMQSAHHYASVYDSAELYELTHAPLYEESAETPITGIPDVRYHMMGEYMRRIIKEAMSSCDLWYREQQPDSRIAPFLSTPRSEHWLADADVTMFMAHYAPPPPQPTLSGRAEVAVRRQFGIPNIPSLPMPR